MFVFCRGIGSRKPTIILIAVFHLIPATVANIVLSHVGIPSEISSFTTVSALMAFFHLS
jgi:hypothetical protein